MRAKRSKSTGRFLKTRSNTGRKHSRKHARRNPAGGGYIQVTKTEAKALRAIAAKAKRR